MFLFGHHLILSRTVSLFLFCLFFSRIDETRFCWCFVFCFVFVVNLFVLFIFVVVVLCVFPFLFMHLISHLQNNILSRSLFLSIRTFFDSSMYAFYLLVGYLYNPRPHYFPRPRYFHFHSLLSLKNII